MNEITKIEATKRVKNLKTYYRNNAPLAVNRELDYAYSLRAKMLYVQGWKESAKKAETVRMRKSMAEAYMLKNLQPIIVPGELLTGQHDIREFSAEERRTYDELMQNYDMIPVRQGRPDHLAMDYQLLLDKGIEGILEILEEKITSIDLDDGTQIEKYEYYVCCKIELEGLCELCHNYAEEAYRMAECAEGEQKKELLELYETLAQVPRKPARTFREALQSIHMFTWSLHGLYSYGKPDVYLLPYYERDLKSGILSLEKAQELLDCFYLLSIPNVSAWAAIGLMLGGRDQNGKKVENALTWHFLKAIQHTHLPDPNIGFCVTEETSEELLKFAAEIIAEGHAQPTIWNSDAVTRSMLKNGYDKDAAHMFTLSTCVEITPIGSSGVSITSPYINLAQILLDALETCDDGCTFEDIFAAFKKELEIYCKEAIRQENIWQLERKRNGTDPIRVSVLIHDCLERGLSNDSGGARYNHLEPNILGMQNTGESLNCIYHAVFVEKKWTLSEYKKALAADYEGYENLRAYIVNKIPHFGSGDMVANKIAKGVADSVLEVFKNKITVRGARVMPGAFSYREHELQGKVTSATPDGRRNGMPLNDGSNPVQGYDRMGPTISLMSTAYWEPSAFLGGTAVNVKINKGVDTEKLIALIKGYIKTEGVQMQFNIVDGKELLKAQRNPENYGDLLVRIGGYSDYFVKLTPELQREVISRSMNKL